MFGVGRLSAGMLRVFACPRNLLLLVVPVLVIRTLIKALAAAMGGLLIVVAAIRNVLITVTSIRGLPLPAGISTTILRIRAALAAVISTTIWRNGAALPAVVSATILRNGAAIPAVMSTTIWRVGAALPAVKSTRIRRIGAALVARLIARFIVRFIARLVEILVVRIRIARLRGIRLVKVCARLFAKLVMVRALLAPSTTASPAPASAATPVGDKLVTIQ